jgi:CRISPR-associated protein Csd1
MLLERLREYALVQMADTVPPAGYQQQPIRYVIPLTLEGRAGGLIDTADKEVKRGELRMAPHAKRSVGIVPKLLADTGEYVLGIGRNDPKKPANPVRVAQQHEQFKALVAACATDTADPLVDAVTRFYETYTPGSETLELPDDYDPSATMTFRVETELPIDLDSVRTWWAASRAPDADETGANSMDCIVCGQRGPVLERHPLKIKGIPGGQILKDLISANAGAFESYGLRASQIAPTCPTCAEAYGNGLNALLGNRATSMWAGGLAYAFWTEPRKANGFNPGPMLTAPDENESEIRKLLNAAFGGQREAILLDPTRFYTVALGASGARAVVKDWIDTTVGNAQRSLARYFALQRMVDRYGEPGKPMPLYWLSGATVRRKETPSDIVTQSLARLALHGTLLPNDLLYLAVRRNRAEQDVTQPRAALIRMVLLSNDSDADLREGAMSSLDTSRTDAAYVCGRLLAIIDRIQWSALGDVNSSVIDKFFGSASSNPASVFPILLRGAQFHLNKLARDKPGAKYNLELALEETTSLLDDFPATLNLKDQGLFALGFYHQRAHERSSVTARRAAREATAAAPEPLA